MNKKILYLSLGVFLVLVIAVVITFVIISGDFECGDNVTFTYNGQRVTYGTMESPNTETCWLDRNLGAERAATAKDDYKAYGDLFQWGRAADGHQLINWTSATQGTPVNDTTETLASSDNPDHSNFIVNSDLPYDWRDPQNDDMWQEDGSGVNNPCPTNWRIPTKLEWDDEITEGGWSDLTDIYNDLKLTFVGPRSSSDASLSSVGSIGGYWSSSVVGSSAFILYFDDYLYPTSSIRANGLSLRCLRD